MKTVESKIHVVFEKNSKLKELKDKKGKGKILAIHFYGLSRNESVTINPTTPKGTVIVVAIFAHLLSVFSLGSADSSEVVEFGNGSGADCGLGELASSLTFQISKHGKATPPTTAMTTQTMIMVVLVILENPDGVPVCEGSGVTAVPALSEAALVVRLDVGLVVVQGVADVGIAVVVVLNRLADGKLV